MATEVKSGLEGIVVAESEICVIDGQRGTLGYRGIDIGALAKHSTYEETVYLLWYGELPSQAQLDEFKTKLVVERTVEEGETVNPGAPLFTLADLSKVTLTIYIAEADIARVKVGQRVVVTVDSYPGREFRGEVVHIATEAEFTPRNVQTKEERVNMVFAVKVEIPNPDEALKPGMPADAAIEIEP